MERTLEDYFLVEARELCEALASGLIALERGAAAEGTLALLFRQAHTLKGAASVVRQGAITELAHTLEDVLAEHRGAGAPLAAPEVGELLRLVDGISAELDRIEAEARQVAALEPSVDAAPAEERVPAMRVEPAQVDELAARLVVAEAQILRLQAAVEELDPIWRQASEIAVELESVTSGEHLRAKAEGLRSLASQARRDLALALDALAREHTQIRAHADTLRLVPASAIFAALERAVRDASRSLDRAASFEASGGEVRLDRSVLGGVRDALLHVVRNAVTHGIEPTEERRRAGKEPTGRISLRVERRGTRAAFIVEDDGRGIDAEAVRRAAVARGMIDPERAAMLDEEEALRLVFQAGLSTAGRVTELAGRGVGLDVAQALATRYQGEVSVATRPGRGATITLAVRLSLSSLVALVVRAGAIAALLPLDAVLGTARLDEGALGRSPDGATVLRDGRALPFMTLEAVLGADASHRSERWTLVFVRTPRGDLALGVDGLRGTVDVVIQPLPAAAGTIRGVAGAALGADQTPLLLLDPEGLHLALAHAPGVTREDRPAASARLPILVIDDSVTTRTLEESILRSAGFEVDLATSAEEGLEKAAKRRYGLFIVDVEMPGMNGFEFVAHTRRDPGLGQIPAMLVTSLGSARDHQRGVQAGAAAYVVKGEFDQGRFLAHVRELLG